MIMSLLIEGSKIFGKAKVFGFDKRDFVCEKGQSHHSSANPYLDI
jgi:hypothetical protein